MLVAVYVVQTAAFWKEDVVVLISIGYTTEKMAPTDKNR